MNLTPLLLQRQPVCDLFQTRPIYLCFIGQKSPSKYGMRDGLVKANIKNIIRPETKSLLTQ